MQPYLALITPLSRGGHPDHELPGGPGHVSPPIYHPGHPDHGLPSAPGHPDQGLPGWGRPPHVGNRPPGSWGGRPDNSLPGQPVDPGWGGGWGGGPRPGNDLPWAPVRPGHGLPGDQPGIDNSLPWGPPGGSVDNTLPGGQPKVHQAAVPPTPPETVNTEEGVWVIVNVNGALAWAWAQKPTQQPPTPEPK